MGNRKIRLIADSGASFFKQLITIICGFILPNLILKTYGSEVNGLVSSINQFLGLITFMELGVGAVVQSALYKPLADKDENEISKIIISAKHFFGKIAIIFAIYIVFLSIGYPYLIGLEFEQEYVIVLIIATSINLFAQYCFSITNQLLLNADQRGYIPSLINVVVLVLNTIICCIEMNMGYTIQTVKITSAFIYLLRPLLLGMYVKKNYCINKKVVIVGEPIKQKWNGFAQHIAIVVLNNTDTVVLTIFSTLSNVSVYNVYNLVALGIKQIITSMTTGMSAYLGNLLARNAREELNESFDVLEWLLHTLVTLLFAITLVLICPFVHVYTLSVKDINYYEPLFATLLILVHMSNCLRVPYNMLILAAGHYKETQISAYIEMILNIVLSITLVLRYGLIGVTIGSLIAVVYRMIYFVIYLSKNIIFRSINYFVKHIFVDILIVISITLITKRFDNTVGTYWQWGVLAIKVSFLGILLSIVVNCVFYGEKVRGLLVMSKKIFKRNR